jgi:hypothetical protein
MSVVSSISNYWLVSISLSPNCFQSLYFVFCHPSIWINWFVSVLYASFLLLWQLCMHQFCGRVSFVCIDFVVCHCCTEQVCSVYRTAVQLQQWEQVQVITICVMLVLNAMAFFFSVDVQPTIKK